MTTTTDWTQVGRLIEVANDPRVSRHLPGTSNWAAAVCQLMAEATRPEHPLPDERQAARKTLQALGYTYHGGELWKPPLGKAPQPAQQVEAENPNPSNDVPNELTRIANIIRDCGRVVDKTGRIEQVLRDASAMLAAPQPAQQPLPEIDYRAAIRAAYETDRKWAQGTTGCIAFMCGAEWYRWTLTHPAQPALRYEPTDEGIGND